MGKEDYCCVPDCNNRRNKNPSLSFHSFPGDKNISKQWIHKVRRDVGPNFNPFSKDTKVCSEHFIQSDYRLTFGGKGRFLKSDAVPSLFKWTSQAAPGRKPPKERHASDTESDDMDVDEGACASPQYVHHASFDHDYAVQPKPIEDKLTEALARIAELE